MVVVAVVVAADAGIDNAVARKAIEEEEEEDEEDEEASNEERRVEWKRWKVERMRLLWIDSEGCFGTVLIP